MQTSLRREQPSLRREVSRCAGRHCSVPQLHASGYARLISSSMTVRSVDGNHYLCKVTLCTWFHGARLTHVVARCKGNASCQLFALAGDARGCTARSTSNLYNIALVDVVARGCTAQYNPMCTWLHDAIVVLVAQAR